MLFLHQSWSLGCVTVTKYLTTTTKKRKRKRKIYFKKVSSDAQVWSTAHHHGGKQGAGAEQRSHCVRSQEAEMNAVTQPTFFFLFSSFHLLQDSGP